MAAAVARRRARDPDPDDRFRGLYVSDQQVDEMLSARPMPAAPGEASAAALAAVEAEADVAQRRGDDLRLRRLAHSFGLDPLDVEILLVALAPDIDARFERLYGYLHDDVTRRRPSAGLSLELCGVSSAGPGRGRLHPLRPLLAGGLLIVEEPDRPFLTRALRVPDRVASHLLGDDTPDPEVDPLLDVPPVAELPGAEPLARALASGVRLVHLRDRPGGAARAVAAAALRIAGLAVLCLDLRRLRPEDDPVRLASAAAREARLRAGGLVAGPLEVLYERGPAAVRAFAELSCPALLVGSRVWDPAWSREVPLSVEAPATGPADRATLWRLAFDGATPAADPAAATAHFRLAPEHVARAALAARRLAAAEGRPVTVADLHAGARAQNAAGLDRLARRIQPRAAWHDLVLPPTVASQLRELAARARHRELVLDLWGMGSRSSRGRGVTALFAGESGTGKTLSAEVLAAELGLDLYVVDLSTVVDKYVGETEKNLDRIFDEADRVNGVLLFDEADALFGKRSEVRDAHDRYANVEVAYLLQRMELFEGLAILTTNLRSNLDEAFTRRLDAVVDFPMPEEDDRLRMWATHLRPGLPREEPLDLEFLARAFRVSGGNIRNITLGAAFLAAGEDQPVGMEHLIRATEREYRKLGNLCLEAEFGPYFGLIKEGVG